MPRVCRLVRLWKGTVGERIPRGMRSYSSFTSGPSCSFSEMEQLNDLNLALWAGKLTRRHSLARAIGRMAGCASAQLISVAMSSILSRMSWRMSRRMVNVAIGGCT